MFSQHVVYVEKTRQKNSARHNKVTDTSTLREKIFRSFGNRAPSYKKTLKKATIQKWTAAYLTPKNQILIGQEALVFICLSSLKWGSSIMIVVLQTTLFIFCPVKIVALSTYPILHLEIRIPRLEIVSPLQFTLTDLSLSKLYLLGNMPKCWLNRFAKWPAF